MRDYHYTELPPSVRLYKTLSILKRLVKGNTRILDVGCGDGTVLSSLERGEKFGSDISLTILNFAAENNGIRLAQAYGDRLPFADKSFDVVTCMEVLEHVPNPSDVIDELARVAKPGGIVLITVPAASWWRIINYRLRGRDEVYLDEKEHLTEYSLVKLKRFTLIRDLLKRISGSGLKIESVSGAYFIPDFLEWRVAPVFLKTSVLLRLYSIYDLITGLFPLIRCMGRYLFISCRAGN